MTSKEIEARKAAIAEEMQADDISLERLGELEQEARGLNDQLAEMEQAAESVLPLPIW